MALKQKSTTQLYTHQDYFSLSEKSPQKYEYNQGVIVAMAGASLNHNRISKNIAVDLDIALEGKPCEPLISDMRVWIEKKDMYVYPDVLVLCGEPEFVEDRTDTIINPTVVIEILSKSTQTHDHTDKFHAYWSLASVKEYVLVNQYQARVEYFRRIDAKKWELLIFHEVDDVLQLKSIGVDLLLERIYRGVDFESSG